MTKGRYALSFSKNPVFKDFIKTICSGEPIVLVLGAGVSIESGLPTWSGLLDQLGESIKDEHLNDLLRAAETDPSRRAALTLSALHMNSGVGDNHRIVETLYKTLPQASGNLLLSLVSLIKRLGSKVKVITLNYDDCLEYALVKDGGYLLRDVHPYALEERDQWKECVNGVAILHVHGFLTRDQREGATTKCDWENKGPVILSEGEYIQYGSTVQQIVHEEAARAHLIFVGTSLTDANITYPLSDRYAHRGGGSGKEVLPLKSAFALLVPNESAATKVYRYMDEDARKKTNIAQLTDTYFSMLSNHIRQTYGITTVRLNSYSQVTQAIREATLAVDNNEHYFDNSDDSSIRDGKRYQRIMRNIYKRLAVAPGGIAPGGNKSRRLSDKLEKALNVRVRPVLNELLEELIDSYANSSGRSDQRWCNEKTARQNFDEERFGLYLWLRSALAKGSDNEFEVFIAGASSYSRRDGITMSQRSTVSQNSIYASARSVASGTMELFSRRYSDDVFERPGEALDRPWNTHWSVPISVSEPDLGTGGAPGRVCVGALVLQSSKYDQAPGEDFDSQKHSLLALVYQNAAHNQRLSECLAQCGTDLVANFPSIERKSSHHRRADCFY